MQYINAQQAKAFEQKCIYAFKDKQLHLIDKPARSEDRRCTDCCCLVVFAILLIGFGAYSVISIHSMFSKNLTKLNPNDNVTFLQGITEEEFQKFGIVVGSCIGGALGISVLILILMKFIPQIMVVGMSYTTVLVILAVSIYDFAVIKSGISGYFIAVGVIYGIFIFYYWDALTKAAILMKTVGHFIVDNLRILLVLFFAMIYCAAVLFLWVGGFYSFCTLYSYNELSYRGFIISLIFWVFMLFFFNFYFYYTSVYLTSSAVAIWFYDKADQYDLVVTPFKFMVRYHLGTITFASLVITFGKLIKLFLLTARLRQTDNAIMCLIGSFSTCLIYCCLGSIQAMIQIINNYAIILCGLTGYSLIESAQLVGQFVFDDPDQLFSQFTIASYFVNAGGMFTVSIIPVLVGGVLLSELSGPLWALGVLIIMFTSSIIGLLFLQIYVQSASTLFLLYIMDGKLAKQGLDVVWIDSFADQLEKGFDQAFVGKIQKQKVKTKSRTTYVIYGDGRLEVSKQKIQIPIIQNVTNQRFVNQVKTYQD